ncbi:non-structural maintenance of chromosomes element 4 homolog A-like isoform X1 [Cucurbita moschata]|uniref:Non-structural maintenance of chromosomes element 4 n=2 Tax=Cucurbita moschata TaxID=3662 RepID=A0A6J1F0F0_CUCMO|nr:non-structural maintenance of chromosomes element 4 homolog A-like isoform X1 [Cucurbita moschata]
MRPVKREPAASSRSNQSKGGDAVDAANLRDVKRARVAREKENIGEGNMAEAEEGQQGLTKRRVLRSRYLAVIHEISERREDLTKDSDKFNVIINEVEKLHEQVQKPREQVADAEALQDIANSLVTSIKSQSNEGVTPSDFVSCLLKEFADIEGGITSEENNPISLSWKDIGLSVSSIFMNGHGCRTMLGPMSTQLKQRKTNIARKRSRPTESSRPAEVDEDGSEAKTDTDKNMSIMFGILRRNKTVRLEHLILNRNSFAQTVENLFALSFLVKDGRAEITIDKNGSHFVSPKNAPAHSAIMSHEVNYSHFVFRFDFKDWKLMMDIVPVGEELMPHRNFLNSAPMPQEEATTDDSESASLPTTPIRKLSRNRGLVMQTVVEDSPDNGAHSGPTAMLRCKKKLSQGSRRK